MAASSLQPTPPPLAGQSEEHSPPPCPCQAAPLSCSGVLAVLVPEAPTTLELVPSVAALGEAVPGAIVRSGHEEAPWELVQSKRSLRRMASAPPAVKSRRPPPVVRTRRPPPAWLNERCLRCHDVGHWALMCCEPL
jgi:hypothetical protein